MNKSKLMLMIVAIFMIVGVGNSATIDVFDTDFTFYTDMGSTYFTITTPPVVENPTLANLNATITLFCWSGGMESTITEDEFVGNWSDATKTFDFFTRYVETSCDGEVYGSVFFDDGVSVAELGLNGFNSSVPTYVNLVTIGSPLLATNLSATQESITIDVSTSSSASCTFYEDYTMSGGSFNTGDFVSHSYDFQMGTPLEFEQFYSFTIYCVFDNNAELVATPFSFSRDAYVEPPVEPPVESGETGLSNVTPVVDGMFGVVGSIVNGMTNLMTGSLLSLVVVGMFIGLMIGVISGLFLYIKSITNSTLKK